MTDFDLSEYVKPNTELILDKQYIESIYADNPIALYCAESIIEQDKTKTDYRKLLLSKLQLSYIELLDRGQSNICSTLDITPSTVAIWCRQSRLFADCLAVVKQAQAERLEMLMWDKANNSEDKDSISRMFLLKARKPEYRENAIQQGDNTVNVHVTIEGERFDTSANFKAKTIDD